MIQASIKNIIFDLGGVIINLSVESTIQGFSELSGKSAGEIQKAYLKYPEFTAYERGELDDTAFRDAVRKIFSFQAPDEQIDRCWNAMLLDIPQERIELLKRLKSKYNLYLLSNTNNIHLLCFKEIVRRTTALPSLDVLFQRAYYSHQMKMRKPEARIYETVLSENKLVPSETLFLDDNPSNLEGAEGVGIKTFHVQKPELIFSLFNESQN